MKIIILGAGQVGGTLAENLVGENNDITIVDTNGDRLRVLQTNLICALSRVMVRTPASFVRRALTMPTCWLR